MTSSVFNLTFHGLGVPKRPLEPGEASVWLTESAFCGVLDAVRSRSDVALSFDDGNASDVQIALPQLCSRGLKAIFFVVASRIGKPGFLDAADIRALAEHGVEIGSHGMGHRPWRGLEGAVLAEETRAARQIIEQHIGSEVRSVACPFGSYDRRVLAELQDCGFQRAYTSDRGWARRSGWLQARNSVRCGEERAVLARLKFPPPLVSRVLCQMKQAIKGLR